MTLPLHSSIAQAGLSARGSVHFIGLCRLCSFRFCGGMADQQYNNVPGRVLAFDDIEAPGIFSTRTAEAGVDFGKAVDGREPFRDVAVHRRAGAISRDRREACSRAPTGSGGSRRTMPGRLRGDLAPSTCACASSHSERDTGMAWALRWNASEQFRGLEDSPEVDEPVVEVVHRPRKCLDGKRAKAFAVFWDLERKSTAPPPKNGST